MKSRLPFEDTGEIMRWANKTFTITASALIVLAVVSGCTTGGTDLVAAGAVSLEKVHSEKVRIVSAEVRQDGENAVVTGSVAAATKSLRGYHGYVEVEFVDSQGELLRRVRTETFYTPPKCSCKGSRSRGFYVSTRMAVPDGGGVRVAYHLGTDDHGS